MTNFCTECGARNEGTNFCASCGFAVQKSDAPFISTAETESSDDWSGVGEGVFELAENILAQCRELMDNANVERVDFFQIDGELAFSVKSDLGVIDTAFDSGLSLNVEDWEPLDDDDEAITDVKHIYLEPDYFFDMNGYGCGGDLFQAIATSLGLKGPDDLRVKGRLKKPAGKKFSYLLAEAN